MKKAKWLIPMTLAGILLSSSAGVYAGTKLEKVQAFKNHAIQVEVKGKAYTPVSATGDKLAPITYEGTTYLPIRSIGESLNTSVLYDAVNNKVMIGGATTDSDTYTEQKAVSSNTASPTASADNTSSSSTSDPSTSSSSSSATSKSSSSNTLSKGVTAPVEVLPGPIDSVSDNAAPVPSTSSSIGMTTGTIQNPYLSADFPFPADATKIKLVQQAVGGKKQLLLVYSTQADLQTVGDAYVAYFTSYNMNFGAVQIDSSGISLVGTVSDEFGVSIQGNPMSLRPGYNSVSVTLAEQ
ncbi:hypothetical protein [Paenibacillus kandeliae]|uniref:hypothetical protein n=1 Tax=Paenibacillus kandeliae TaxID=3231269 RepID=UPI0034585575